MGLRQLKQPTILNSKGEVIKLNKMEQYHADYTQRLVNERFANTLGYEVSITTLTTVIKKVSEQKFFEVTPSEYLPIRVGEGAWSTNLTTFRSFNVADDFETGIMNVGGGNGRLASADAAVDSLNIKVYPWGKQIGWSIFELEYAAKSGNWDLVSAREESRKKNWDLGIQRIAFLGAKGNNAAGGACLGLLNQGGVTVDTTTITKAISAMTVTELKSFVQVVVEKYRANCNRTCWPTHFIIPESDYNGLASQASADFPIKSVLALLEEAFQLICRNKGFKILPLAYGDASFNTAEINKQCYVLLNYDDKSVRMDVPLAYTNTLANSIDNFSFQNVGFGQFTGVLAYRPLEMLYFQY